MQSLGGFPAMDELQGAQKHPREPIEQPEIQEDPKAVPDVPQMDFGIDSNPIQLVTPETTDPSSKPTEEQKPQPSTLAPQPPAPGSPEEGPTFHTPQTLSDPPTPLNTEIKVAAETKPEIKPSPFDDLDLLI